ncbi:hypothetical protein [Herbidospora sp. NBRC 101105]|uniref:hypothetical protein n=1 Tax=Herbidospora sp. NBRC 101105 TaxID=3032195 RepID=UPI0024A54367|nr:hypothetical protein [Herbidospora sp. NBRC 101105]GLX96731.1 hypothetical protein Hesp01_46810 [Herbidospora sp. NBRC 101105]
MTREPSPDARAAELRQAGEWLASRDLGGVRPTPLLADRLAARQRARLAGSVILALLILASALAATVNRFGPDDFRPMALPALAVVVAGLLVAQSLLHGWVRRVDRRAGATLSRRAAHLIQPGWRTVLGRPYAVFSGAVFAASVLLAGSALAVPDRTVRELTVVMLIGLVGVYAITALQLRHLLRHPVVAEDEDSLTADVIMRVEDARELTTPSVQWSLPMVLLFGTAPGWWSAAALAYVLVSLAAFATLQTKAPSSTTVARQAVTAR